MDAIIITGMGVISPAGFTPDVFFETLARGRPVYGRLEELETDEGYRVKIGARIRKDGWSRALSAEERNRYGRASQYALAAARCALEDAGLTTKDCRSRRMAVVVGTTMGEIGVEEAYTRRRSERPPADKESFLCQVEHGALRRRLPTRRAEPPCFMSCPRPAPRETTPSLWRRVCLRPVRLIWQLPVEWTSFPAWRLPVFSACFP